MPNVLVIDGSASVRETLRIVLGHEHVVTAVAGIGDLARGLAPDVAVVGLGPGERERTAVARAFDRELADVPVLFLHAARDLDVGRLVPPPVAVDFLAKPFDAYAIRARVRKLAAARTAARQADEARRDDRRWLEPPLIGSAAAAVVQRVLAGALDVVLLQGEPGSGLTDVARALHAASRGAARFVAVDAAGLARGAITAAVSAESQCTLFVEHVDRAAHEVQTDLVDVIRDVRAGRRRLRVIGGTARDLLALAAEGAFVPELAHQLTTVPVLLAPLRDRADDVPALAASIARAWAPRLGLGDVVFPEPTLDRLRQYLWFGNVAELEAVVVRTLVLHRPTIVQPEHVVFLPEDAARAVAPAADSVAVTSSDAPLGDALRPVDAAPGVDFEVLLGELAHELRNPMVTIKTVAQHLDGILADPEARARFSALMTDAVGRMDGVVETLLDFARFRAPVRRAVNLGALLDRALDEQRDELDRLHVHVDRNGHGFGSVDVDEAQMRFALASLCRGLVPSLVPGSTLAIRALESGSFEMIGRAEPSVASRLSAWVEPRQAADGETPPLSWALAAALFARNGAALTVRKLDDRSMVVRVDWGRPARSENANAVGRTEW